MSTTRAQVDLPLSFPHLLFGARARWFSVFAFYGRAASVFSLEFVRSFEKKKKKHFPPLRICLRFLLVSEYRSFLCRQNYVGFDFLGPDF